VTSFNRPGGNVTGISFMTAEMGTKLLGLLHELLPQAARFVALVNPTSLLAEPFIKDLQAGARTLGLQAEVLYAGTDCEIDAAFATLVQKRADVLLIASCSSSFARSKYRLAMNASCAHCLRRDGGSRARVRQVDYLAFASVKREACQLPK
jgi:putative ABC transport system substrate-binding protein